MNVKMEGQEYIDQTREYLNYLEEHLNNIYKAFNELSKACDGMAWVGDDKSWHTLKREVELHDLSKFSKEEFTQYRDKFFNTKKHLLGTQHEINMDFGRAWTNHKKHNTHHWENISWDVDYPGITENKLIHMLIDWTAMGYKFGDTAQSYYESNLRKINLDVPSHKFIYTIFSKLKEAQYE